MKKLSYLLLTLVMVACSPKGSKPPGSIGTDSSFETEGGVDVGNMRSAIVPTTAIAVTYPTNWSPATTETSLSLKNKSGSSIEAQRAEIKDLASPNAVGLQQYLKLKHPSRDYKIVNFNGLEGVRADLTDTPASKKSDLYLVSELKDFIHVQSDLKKADEGLAEGEKILLTVRVKYQGVAYENPQKKTVTLTARNNYNKDKGDFHAYSFLGDCYTYSNECNPQGGVGSSYEGRFRIGTAGYAHGRVVELGPESQIPFESIKVEGKFLVAPNSNTPISDIYTAFKPKSLKVDQNDIELKEGYVYLVRTINWPEEDLITKMRVENLNGGLSVTITYEKLVYVKKEDLQKQVDLINKYTLENEAPLSTGEVTLYSRSYWDNYYYASFNFQYSTSGNMFITRNGWDLLFENGCDGKPNFDVPHSGAGIGEAIDLGSKDLDSVSLADFPDPNNYKRTCGIEVIKGHTYALYNYDYGDESSSLIRGAVHVLDLDPEGKWVRLKFKRIFVGPADYFQKWINLSIPQDVQSLTLEKTDSSKTAVFYPFIAKRGDQGSHYYEYMYFSENRLSVDSRPYGSGRGFYKLPPGTSIESVSSQDVESLKGKFSSTIDLANGDVVAILLENYYVKTVMVMKVESLEKDKALQLSTKYLQRAKTAYLEDK